jgi:hypothetical protein
LLLVVPTDAPLTASLVLTLLPDPLATLLTFERTALVGLLLALTAASVGLLLAAAVIVVALMVFHCQLLQMMHTLTIYI